jgi:hypothetical protein
MLRRRFDSSHKVAAIAHREGLRYAGDRVLANSFDVHRVLHLAGTVGLANQLISASSCGGEGSACLGHPLC